MLCGVVFEEVGDGGVWTAGHLGLLSWRRHDEGVVAQRTGYLVCSRHLLVHGQFCLCDVAAVLWEDAQRVHVA